MTSGLLDYPEMHGHFALAVLGKRENNERTTGLHATRSVPWFSYQTREPDVDMNGIKELIGSISAAIGKADMPVAVLDTHGVLFAGQYLPAHQAHGTLPINCQSHPWPLPACARSAVTDRQTVEQAIPPYLLAGFKAQVGASIGIHLAGADADKTPEAIIAQADNAMYEAKRRGKGRYFLLADDT